MKKSKREPGIKAYPCGMTISNCVIMQLDDKQMKDLKSFMVKLFKGKKP